MKLLVLLLIYTLFKTTNLSIHTMHSVATQIFVCYFTMWTFTFLALPSEHLNGSLQLCLLKFLLQLCLTLLKEERSMDSIHALLFWSRGAYWIPIRIFLISFCSADTNRCEDGSHAGWSDGSSEICDSVGRILGNQLGWCDEMRID